MTVYADVLIITNLITDYFLLSVTSRIIRGSPPVWRLILSSFAAAVSTLIIFLPQQSKASETVFKIIICYIICGICFGIKNKRKFLFSGAVFFAVSFCYAGAMLAVWSVFKPHGMVINNSVVYFDISPLFLIIFSVAGFLIFSALSLIFGKRDAVARECFVNLRFCGKSAGFNGIIDSGNSLFDPITGGSVIVVDRDKFSSVFGSASAEEYPQKYRAVPCGTVSGNVLLDGLRCESAKIITKGKTVDIKTPIAAFSKTPLCDCEAIVNPIDCE